MPKRGGSRGRCGQPPCMNTQKEGRLTRVFIPGCMSDPRGKVYKYPMPMMLPGGTDAEPLWEGVQPLAIGGLEGHLCPGQLKCAAKEVWNIIFNLSSEENPQFGPSSSLAIWESSMNINSKFPDIWGFWSHQLGPVDNLLSSRPRSR